MDEIQSFWEEDLHNHIVENLETKLVLEILDKVREIYIREMLTRKNQFKSEFTLQMEKDMDLISNIFTSCQLSDNLILTKTITLSYLWEFINPDRTSEQLKETMKKNENSASRF